MFVHGSERPPNVEVTHAEARPRVDARSGLPEQVAATAILALQRSAGNVAVTRLVSADAPDRRPVVQRKPENTRFTKATENAKGVRFTEDGYLDYVKKSVEAGRPMAFIVNAILSYREISRIPAVIAAIVHGFSGEGRIAVIVGINAPAGEAAQLDEALANAREIIERLPLPVALVRSVFHGKFPYGTMRNEVLHSDECLRMTAAFAASGKHPYVSVQDFDTGSRQVRGGIHVFDHFERRLEHEDKATSSSSSSSSSSSDDMATEHLRPVRPLLAAGGYRLDASDDELVSAVRDRYRKERRAFPDELAEQPTEEQLARRKDFLNRFRQAVDNDMEQRDRLAKIHPLLPYAPEPNLLLDALPNLLGRGAASAGKDEYPFAFGPKRSEFSSLGQGVNAFNAWELSKHYSRQHEEAPQSSAVAPTTPSSGRFYHIPQGAHEVPGEEFAPADHPTIEEDRDDIHERVKIDAENNRLPERGPAVVTDFAAGAIGTDLSRLAAAFLQTGKLPQNHVELTSVVNSFYASREAKKNTKLAAYRDGYTATAGYPALTPQEARMLGNSKKNRMGPNVSAPLSGAFSGISAGVSVDHKLVATRELALATLHRKRFLATIQAMLRETRGTPMDGDCLYHAVNQARTGTTDSGKAEALRQQVVDWMLDDANLEDVATLAHDKDVDLVGLINTVATKGSWAGNAGDLAPTVVARALGITLVIHLPDGSAHPVGDGGAHYHLDLADDHYSVRGAAASSTSGSSAM